jgi:DNA segregation ATPase FtsK/SpoIIIE-like protein
MPSALSVVRPAGAAVLLLAAVAATGVVLYLSWPVGVALGLALGAGAVLAIGARMQRTERLQPADVELAAELGILHAAPEAPAPAAVAPVEVPEVLAPVLHVQPDVLYFTSDDDPDQVEAREVVADPVTTEIAVVDPVRGDLERLKVELGEDYRDFARAARLVVSTQYASAARLQRDLDLPYSRARRLLADLEQQHFVGPATGSLPRQVLLPKDRLPEVEQLLAEV